MGLTQRPSSKELSTMLSPASLEGLKAEVAREVLRRRVALTINLPPPHPMQAEVLRSARRFNVLACGRRWGKSRLAVRLCIEPALQGKPTAYLAPTYKMLLETWRELLREIRPAIARLNEQEHRVEIAGGGLVEMWSLTDPNTARGRKYARVVVDEAALVDNLLEAWQAVLRPTLTDLSGDAWFMSTPRGESGDFHTLFEYGREGAELALPNWISWQRPSHDNPFLPVEELKALETDLDPLVYEQEVLAHFVNAGNQDRFLPSMVLWDACKEDLPPLGAREPMVLAADAGVTNDFFAVVGVSRHPSPDRRRRDVAVRLCRVWRPPKGGGQISFAEAEAFIREVCKAFNVVQFCYDPYMLVDLGQRLNQDTAVWPSEFSQGDSRLEADKLLLDLIMEKRLAHSGDPTLREHVDNADRKPDIESRKLRIVKREGRLKIDACVALSMACARALKLDLS